MKRMFRGTAHGGRWITGLAIAMVMFVASPALADTSAATANAIRATLGTGSLLDSGTVTAVNDGDDPNPGVVTGNTNPALSVLGLQTLLSVGLLPQQAEANINGTSAACAGLVGTGGLVQIGPAGDCTVTGAPTGGVSLNLGPAGLLGTLGLSADAILAQCTASSTGAPTATVFLVNASINLSPLGLPVINIPLPASPSAGVTPDLGLLGLGGLLTLTLNEQSTPGGVASIATTALHLNLLNLIDLRIGNVTCGPNAVQAPPPAIPLQGLPIAAATLGVVGGAVAFVRRRRASTPSAAA